MQPIFAIIRLTLKAALRFRLVPVMIVLLLGSVVALPLIIKDDGTAQGFTQIILTYTLACITALLGFTTLWLACGTLAGDVADAQIQMVVVKPVARWQIWIGKWLGILILDAVLLAISAAAVYGLMQWRASSLSQAEQAILRNRIMVSRATITTSMSNEDIEEMTTEQLQARAAQGNFDLSESDLAILRMQIREGIKQSIQIVQPRYVRVWPIDLADVKDSLANKRLTLRTKFTTASDLAGATYVGQWGIGDPTTARFLQTQIVMAPGMPYEFDLNPNLIDESGVLNVRFANVNAAALLFPMEDGMTLLYPESTFGFNYARGIMIIFLWMVFLASLGLAASSYLSFPVAALVSMAVLIVFASSDSLMLVLQQGSVFSVNPNTGRADHPAPLDYIALPVIHAIASVIQSVKIFTPIEALSTGKYIPWWEIWRAFLRIGVFISGPIILCGILAFNRRELASEQSNT